MSNETNEDLSQKAVEDALVKIGKIRDANYMGKLVENSPSVIRLNVSGQLAKFIIEQGYGSIVCSEDDTPHFVLNKF